MTAWHVWSDGSCQNEEGGLGFGGWASIVEHGSDGTAYRGRVDATTNVRMELRAATEGLRHVADGARVVLHIDCTVIVSVYQLWRQGGRALSGKQCRDHADWMLLGAQLDRVQATLDVLQRGPRPGQHRRAHVMAGAEARAGVRGLPADAIPVDDARRLRRATQRDTARRSIHAPGCQPAMCIDSCPVHIGELVRRSRRTSEARR